jgi:peroxiredoxin Q/BCP
VFDFSALAHTGQSFRLSEFLERPALVYFCPADATPQCSQVALGLRDQWLLLNPSLSMAFGVSGDDTFVHRDFASEHELPHLLVADGDQTVHRLFGLQLGALSAYLIGNDRRVLRVLQPIDTARFAEQVRGALGELGLERPVPPI